MQKKDIFKITESQKSPPSDFSGYINPKGLIEEIKYGDSLKGTERKNEVEESLELTNVHIKPYLLKNSEAKDHEFSKDMSSSFSHNDFEVILKKVSIKK
jgi:hypothetical protein